MENKIYQIILKEYNKTQPSWLFWLHIKSLSIPDEIMEEFWKIKQKLFGEKI